MEEISSFQTSKIDVFLGCILDTLTAITAYLVQTLVSDVAVLPKCPDESFSFSGMCGFFVPKT